MPDLVTHAAIAHLIRRPFDFVESAGAVPSLRILFYLGTILPDILTRPWYILFPVTHDWTLPFHTPAGALAACGLLALLFEPGLQKKAFWLLAAGSILHFILDGFQKQIIGNNFWLYPFTWKDFGYGVIWAGEIMRYIPYWLGLVVILEIGMAVYHRARKRDFGGSGFGIRG
jgi:hypothetical protein